MTTFSNPALKSKKEKKKKMIATPAVRARLGRVLFDLDGTIVDTEPLCQSTILRCLSRWGVSPPGDFRDKMAGVSWARAADLLAPLGLPVTASEAVATMTKEYAHSLMGLSKSEVRGLALPGVVEAIRGFNGLGVPLALVSGSATEDCEFVLSSLGVRDSFSLVLGFELYKRSKPSPDGFQLAADTLSGRGRSIIFEDSKPGLQAALQVKDSLVVAVSACAHGQDQSEAHLAINDFREVTQEWLERALLLLEKKK